MQISSNGQASTEPLQRGDLTAGFAVHLGRSGLGFRRGEGSHKPAEVGELINGSLLQLNSLCLYDKQQIFQTLKPFSQ